MTEIELDLATLGQLGGQAKRLFQQLIGQFDKLPENEESNPPKTKFVAEADRFSLWAVNMGLFVAGHGSLDYRVRDALNIQEMIRTFMLTLNNAIVEAYTYYSQENENEDSTKSPTDSESDGEVSDDGWNGDSDEEMESDQDLLLDSIRDPIDRLYKLSTFIRNPSSRIVSSKMHHHKQIDPETGIDLLDSIKEFDLDYIRSVFNQYRQSKTQEEHKLLNITHQFVAEDEPVTPAVDERQQTDVSHSFLISRLALANARRRQQFSYWKKHRQKLAQHTTTIGNLDTKTRASTVYAPAPHPNVLKTQLEISARVPSLMLPLSVTTATQLQILTQPVIKDNLSTVSVSKYEPSLWQPGNDRLDFPPPPKIPSHQRFFECPYCYTLCPNAISEEEAWRAHLIHDLRPYVCTYEDCRNSDQLYDTRRDWIHHESSTHRRVFYCSEHPDQTFYKSQDYLEHMKTGHLGYSEEISAALLINANESTLIVPDRCCPICTLSIESMEALQKHIAVHLERFSLFSLPKDVGGEDWQGAASNYSEEANINIQGSRDYDFENESFIVSEDEEMIDRLEAGNLEESPYLGPDNPVTLKNSTSPRIGRGGNNSAAVDVLSEEDWESNADIPEADGREADDSTKFRYLEKYLDKSNDYYPTTDKMQELGKEADLLLPSVRIWFSGALDQQVSTHSRPAECIFYWLDCKFASSDYDEAEDPIRRKSCVDPDWNGYYFASPYEFETETDTSNSLSKTVETSQGNTENQNASSRKSLQYQVQVAVSSRNYWEALRLVHSHPALVDIALQIAGAGRKQALEQYLYSLQNSDLISRKFLPQSNPTIIHLLSDLDKKSPLGCHDIQHDELMDIIEQELRRLQALLTEGEEKTGNCKPSIEENSEQGSDVEEYDADLQKSNETSYPCPNCNSELGSKNNLKKHMRDRECISESTPIDAFSAANLWRCPHLACSHIYASKKNLARHYSSVHHQRLQDLETKDDDEKQLAETPKEIKQWKIHVLSPKISKIKEMLALLDQRIVELRPVGNNVNEKLFLIRSFLRDLQLKFFELQIEAKEVRSLKSVLSIYSKTDKILRKTLVGNFTLSLWQENAPSDASIPLTICLICLKSALQPAYKYFCNTICSPCHLILEVLGISLIPRGESSENSMGVPQEPTISLGPTQTPSEDLKSPLESELNISRTLEESLRKEAGLLENYLTQIRGLIRDFKLDEYSHADVKNYVELIQSLMLDLEAECSALQNTFWNMIGDVISTVDLENLKQSLLSIPRNIENVSRSLKVLAERKAESSHTAPYGVGTAGLPACGYCFETRRRPLWVPSSAPWTVICNNCRRDFEQNLRECTPLSMDQFATLTGATKGQRNRTQQGEFSLNEAVGQTLSRIPDAILGLRSRTAGGGHTIQTPPERLIRYHAPNFIRYRNLIIYAAGPTAIEYTLPIAIRAAETNSRLRKNILFIWTAKLPLQIEIYRKQLERLASVPAFTHTITIRIHETPRAEKAEKGKSGSGYLQPLGNIFRGFTKQNNQSTEINTTDMADTTTDTPPRKIAQSQSSQQLTYSTRDILSKFRFEGRINIKQTWQEFFQMNAIRARDNVAIIGYGRGSEVFLEAARKSRGPRVPDIDVYTCNPVPDRPDSEHYFTVDTTSARL
ncbi:hypothetical protein H072_7430 [Dactylellina haptotyla CBS 200.50]|uniref:C2H2-type domain-containing protein n=1 Tax=Dactylellina haptotyla (strain CBS 200.50) TaxID=1284197 RepID=S8ACM1_DACHA|nr:hypothetical protein H072_7430 [Dactylellina haptotyla CBS 200.50]